jgi:YggT family protein
MQIIPYVVIKILELYQLLIVAWAFGSFFPQWQYQKWYKVLGEIVQPYLNLFRFLPLRISMGAGYMDLTPIVALLALQIFERLIITATSGGR